MKNLYLQTFLLIALLTVMPFDSIGQSAESYLKAMDDLMSAPKDKQAKVKMVLKDRSGKEKVREAEMFQKGQYHKLYRYTQPEKQAGIATLSLPDDIIWLYMPAFGKPVKISLLTKSQAFTGTDFSYEDMSGAGYNERYYPMITTSNDKQVILQLSPRNTKSKYTKILLYLDKEHNYPLKMEYYDKNNTFFKYAEYSYTKQGKYWYAKEVKMVDIRKEHSTEIILTDLKFDQGLSDDLFTVETLKPAK